MYSIYTVYMEKHNTKCLKLDSYTPSKYIYLCCFIYDRLPVFIMVAGGRGLTRIRYGCSLKELLGCSDSYHRSLPQKSTKMGKVTWHTSPGHPHHPSTSTAAHNILDIFCTQCSSRSSRSGSKMAVAQREEDYSEGSLPF